MSRTCRRLLTAWLILGSILFLLCWHRAAEAQPLCPPGRCGPGGCGVGTPAQSWQVPPIQQRQPSSQLPLAVFRVVIYDTNGSISYQTGCLVWKHASADMAFVVTSAHGFTSDSRKVLVLYPNGGGFTAIVKSVDHVWDVAVLAIRRPAAGVFRFAARRPVINQILRLGGFVGGKAWRLQDGRLTDWAGPGRGEHPFELLVIGRPVESGQSGGPILDSAGCLVGIISAGDSDTSGPAYWHIQAAIEKVLSGADAEATRPAVDDSPPLPESSTHDDLRLLIQQNAEAIAALAAVARVPGPPGEPGPPGPPGESPALDYTQLAAEVAKRLPPVVLQTVKPDGTVIKESSAPLGKPIKLRLVPVTPSGAK